ncbi:MAG: hypothetical protein RSD74_01645 [Angelakisella sp.]
MSFKCSVCGKDYPTDVEMAKCILSCSEKKRKEEESRDRETNKNADRAVIDELIAKRKQLSTEVISKCKTIDKISNEIYLNVKEYLHKYPESFTAECGTIHPSAIYTSTPTEKVKYVNLFDALSSL